MSQSHSADPAIVSWPSPCSHAAGISQTPQFDGWLAPSPAVWLIVGYMWLFVHRPFEIWASLSSYRIERVYMIVTVLVWMGFVPKKVVHNRFHAWWMTFVLMVLASWQFSDYSHLGSPVVENLLKVAVFYVLVVTSVRTDRDFRFLILAYVASIGLFMLHSYREYLSGSITYAQGVFRMKAVGVTFSDPNDFSGLIVSSLPFAYLLWTFWRGFWRRIAVSVYVVLTFACALLTGSRMGFAGLVICVFLACLVSAKRWIAVPALVVLLAVGWSALPESMRNRYLSIIDTSYVSEEAARSAQARTGGLYRGLALWEQRPVLGVGPGAFGVAQGGRQEAHNLYGQALGETGSLGALAFVGIVICFVVNVLEARKLVRERSGPVSQFAYQTVWACFACVVLLMIMGWGCHFLFHHEWLWMSAFQAVALDQLRRLTSDPLGLAMS